MALYPKILKCFNNSFAFSKAIRTAAFSRTSDVSSTDVSTTDVSPAPPLILDTSEGIRRTQEDTRISWVESLNSINHEPIGMISLHPNVFASRPRLDIIHRNVVWQTNYRKVNYAQVKLRSEVRGGGRKPWPQKGTGRARHGSIRSPIWRKGGHSHGPRRYTNNFYMLPFHYRVQGLMSTLSCKFSQDDLKIVDSLEIPSEEPGYLEDLFDERNWGPSVLMIDDNDVMPRNISIASAHIDHVNLLPTYGLNVYSMLKYTTLVLTVKAVEKITEKLLFHSNKIDVQYKSLQKYRPMH